MQTPNSFSDTLSNQVNLDATLDLVIGPMMAGKTTELVKMAHSNTLVNTPYITIFVNSNIDNRQDKVFSTHSSVLNEFNPIKTDLEDITKEYIRNCLDSGTFILFTKVDCILDLESVLMTRLVEYIVVDEGQFFPDIHLADDIVNDFGISVVVGGLVGDYNRNRFGDIMDLIPKADNIKTLKSMCTNCLINGKKKEASFSFRSHVDEDESVVDVGGSEKYKALCRRCYNAEML